jgi:hypothetical protein
MKFTGEDVPYLTGEQLATVRNFRIANSEKYLPSRRECLVRRVAGKRVIDLGCTDHVVTIDEKIQNGTWLHRHIADAASRCIGFDINSEAVDHVREKHGQRDIHCYDFFDSPVFPDLLEQHWDYLLMGEMLEHIDNPVLMLSALRNKYAGLIDRVILTVPNAFKLSMVKDALLHRETNNTDHRYCFTPFTLAKVVTRAGLTVEEFEFCHLDAIPSYGFLKRLVYTRFPAFRNNLLLVARL